MNKASEDQLAKAKELLAKAGFTEPENRLTAEVIIQTADEQAVEQLIKTLEEYIAEKEAAYAEFKQQTAELLKDSLDTKTE